MLFGDLLAVDAAVLRWSMLRRWWEDEERGCWRGSASFLLLPGRDPESGRERPSLASVPAPDLL